MYLHTLSLPCPLSVYDAFGDLVARMNPACCCASLRTVPSGRHADYIGSWLEVLREDNRASVRAASPASKAADWLLAFHPDAAAASDEDETADARRAA